ncbi:uncharacterized protein B0T23DRAFT_421014 [Neurospora hispaniola]|uniref:Uncharacterized protein n=1 Tax=Neurospora hispaniola TaxID=588809 RepID=A0AAJ0I5M5_9PEZI|nr:hypothetical protein B0T23DRAFT_421014 [Neurospora hispaniola]
MGKNKPIDPKQRARQLLRFHAAEHPYAVKITESDLDLARRLQPAFNPEADPVEADDRNPYPQTWESQKGSLPSGLSTEASRDSSAGIDSAAPNSPSGQPRQDKGKAKATASTSTLSSAPSSRSSKSNSTTQSLPFGPSTQPSTVRRIKIQVPKSTRVPRLASPSQDRSSSPDPLGSSTLPVEELDQLPKDQEPQYNLLEFRESQFGPQAFGKTPRLLDEQSFVNSPHSPVRHSPAARPSPINTRTRRSPLRSSPPAVDGWNLNLQEDDDIETGTPRSRKFRPGDATSRQTTADRIPSNYPDSPHISFNFESRNPSFDSDVDVTSSTNPESNTAHKDSTARQQPAAKSDSQPGRQLSPKRQVSLNPNEMSSNNNNNNPNQPLTRQAAAELMAAAFQRARETAN